MQRKLSQEEVQVLLEKQDIGYLGTVDESGCPYVTPVHFVYREDKVYIHGAQKGEKMRNAQACQQVCLTVAACGELVVSPRAQTACNVNMEYESVILRGCGPSGGGRGEGGDPLGLHREIYAIYGRITHASDLHRPYRHPGDHAGADQR